MVSDLTIQRFFSVHYVVPIAGAGILLFHLLFLHGSGSGALTGTQGGAVDAGGFGVVLEGHAARIVYTKSRSINNMSGVT